VSDWYDDSLDDVDDNPGDADTYFDWDDGNRHKLDDHHVTVEEVQEAVLDPDRKPASAYNVGAERRRAIVGETLKGDILFVVYTERSGRIRVISARLAKPDERRKYWRS
jgi:uncharacterized DUF497 family protein